MKENLKYNIIYIYMKGIYKNEKGEIINNQFNERESEI